MNSTLNMSILLVVCDILGRVSWRNHVDAARRLDLDWHASSHDARGHCGGSKADICCGLSWQPDLPHHTHSVHTAYCWVWSVLYSIILQLISLFTERMPNLDGVCNMFVCFIGTSRARLNELCHARVDSKIIVHAVNWCYSDRLEINLSVIQIYWSR